MVFDAQKPSMANIEREQLLALKVMRLTRPILSRANAVYLDGRDVDSTDDPFALTNLNDANILHEVPYETNSPILILPQSFGNIFLGETFACYISVHNPSQSVCRNVSFKIEVQTNTNKFTVPSSRSSNPIAELPPGQSFDDIIQHEVKEMGTHILICTVICSTVTNPRFELKKHYKFQVLKPIELKTKFLDAEDGVVYLEAQIQNISANGIYLEVVSLDIAPQFTFEDLSRINISDPFERYINPLDMYQFLFRITPTADVRDNPKLLKATTAIGRLDIQWRSSMGEKGRLQTSPLQRMVPGSGDIKLTVKSMQSKVALEQEVDITLQLINASEKTMDLRVELTNQPSCGILWQGLSGRQVGSLQSNQSIMLHYTFIPIKTGLQSVSGIKLIDMLQKRSYEYDAIAHLFVQ